MQVEIYKNQSDLAKVSKIITLLSSLNCELKNETNVMDPVLIVSITENLYNSNYCYIPTFGRYYFINDIRVIDAHRAELSCHVDVLMTYWDQIKETTQNIVRSEKYASGNKSYNMYLQDSQLQVLARTNRWCKWLKEPAGGSPFASNPNGDGHCFVLSSL